MNFAKKFLVAVYFLGANSLHAQTKEELFDAFNTKNWELIKKIILEKPDLVNAQEDEENNTPLHQAVMAKNIELIQFLLQHGADYGIKNGFGKSPYQLALDKAGSQEIYGDILKLFMTKPRAGASLEDQLFHYLRINTISEVKKLITEHPVLVNARNNVQDTPLHFAVMKDKDLTRFLLNNGALVNGENNFGQTPLFEVVNPEIAEILIAKGAEVNKQSTGGETPLFNAAYRGNKELVKVLLNHGAQVNVQKKNNNETPLHMVIRQMPPGFHLSPQKTKNFEEIVKLLLEHGADFSIPSNSGLTPLKLAQELKETNVITFIDDYKKSPINLTNNLAELALNLAALTSTL